MTSATAALFPKCHLDRSEALQETVHTEAGF
jgi:hypothetical protein